MTTRLEDELNAGTAQFEQVHQQLEQQVADCTQELRAFSYSVSHDLQAPLRAITGYSTILSEKYQDDLDEEGRQIVSIIVRNADRMSLLITKVSEYARLQQQAVQPMSLDMCCLFHTVYQQLQVAEPASRTIDFHVGNLPSGYGDPTMIDKAIAHLLSNALKFTRPRTPAVIRVEGHREENSSVYSIQDNGVGFNERYQASMFEIFQRLHKEREFEGTGAGLAMVYSIVHKHGGKVWGSGQPGQGATFTFTLPITEGL